MRHFDPWVQTWQESLRGSTSLLRIEPTVKKHTSNYSFESVVIPSGSFALGLDPFYSTAGASVVGVRSEESPLPASVVICNPMPRRSVDLALIDAVAPPAADQLVAGLRNPERVIDDTALATYARRVVEIGIDALIVESQLMIFPLRGGLKPGLQLEVLTEYHLPTLWLPFTAGSQGGYDPSVAGLLREAFEKLLAEGRELRISVVDTAISGHGARHLAVIMADVLSRYAPRTSDVVFYVLHDQARFPGESNALEGLTTPHVAFRRRLYPVDSLLVEDWAEAIGVEVAFDGGIPILIKPTTTEGQLIVRSNEGIRIYQSQELSHAVDLLIAKSIDEEIRTYPEAAHLRDVWQRYVER